MSLERRKKAARHAPGIFADTGGWYALVDKSDPDHPQAKDWFRQNRMPLITTDYILDEALTLIRTGLGHREAVEFGEKLLASRLARLIPVTKEPRLSDCWFVVWLTTHRVGTQPVFSQNPLG